MAAASRSFRLPSLCAAALVLVLGLCPARAAAQSAPADTTEAYEMTLRGVPLATALESLVDVTHINLIYDAELAEEATVFCRAEDVPAEELLRCILSDTDLDYYQTSAGTYVLRKSPRRTPDFGRLAGVVVDAETGEPLPNANVFLAEASTGTATGEAGSFQFSRLLPGPHALTVTHVGYETRVDSVWVPADGAKREEVPLEREAVETDPVVIDGIQQRLPSNGLGSVRGTEEETTTLRGIGTPDVARSLGALMGTSVHGPLAALHIQGGGTAEHELQLDGVPVRNPYSFGRLLSAFSPLAIGEFTVHKTGFGAEHGSHLSGVVDARHNVHPSAPSNVQVQSDPVSTNARLHGQAQLGDGVEGTAMVAARHSLWDLVQDPTLDQLMQDWNRFDPLLTSAILPDTSEVPGLIPEQQQNATRFADVHAATQLRFSSYSRLYASVYHGRNTIQTDLFGEPVASDWSDGEVPTSEEEADDNALSDQFVQARDDYSWRNWMGQARYEWMSGSRLMGHVQVYGSHHWLRRSYALSDSEEAVAAPEDFRSFDTIVPALLPDDGNELTEIGARAAFDYSLSSRHRLRATVEATRLSSRFQIDDGFFRPLDYDQTRWQWSSHLEHRASLGAGTTVEGGARLTYIPSRQTAYAEPRLAIRHDGSHGFWGDYGLRLATGLYRSFTNQFSLSNTGPTALVPSLQFWLPVDASLAPPRAYHVSGEAFFSPHPNWTVNVETYYKRQARLLSIDYGALLGSAGARRASDLAVLSTDSQTDFISSSHGHTYGGGLRVSREGARLDYTLRYDYTRAQRTYPSRFDDRLETTPWNEPHRLSLETELNITDRLSTRLQWKGVWGRTWGFRQPYYDFLALQLPSDLELSEEFDIPDLNTPSDDQLPPMYRLDAGLSYTQSWGSLQFNAELMISNVLDRDNVFDWSLNPTEDGLERTNRLLPDRRPVLSITIGY